MSSQLLPWEHDVEMCHAYFVESDYDPYMNIASQLMDTVGFPKNEQAQLAYDMALKTLCQGPAASKHDRARRYVEKALNLQAEMKTDDINNGWKPSPMIAWLDARANDLMEKINKDEQDPFTPSQQHSKNTENCPPRMVQAYDPSYIATAASYDVPDSPESYLSAAFTTANSHSSSATSMKSRSTAVPPRTPLTTGITEEMIAHFGYKSDGKVPFPDITSEYSPLDEPTAGQVVSDGQEIDGRGEASVQQLTQQLQEPRWNRKWQDDPPKISLDGKPFASSRLLKRRGRTSHMTVLDTAGANEKILPSEIEGLELVQGEQL